MLTRLQTTLSIGLCAVLAASPVLANPPPGKGKPGHQNDGVQIDLRGPSVDIGKVRIILGENRQLIAPTSSLPPGIAKNLARGKPLPPGIAKQIDPALARQLPYYPGYEWRQYGTDAVLVEVGTTVVREVLRDILR